ncbi:acyltransferase family protein [Tardiphaga sp. 604_B6_N1_1]|uniref:acyltransferase family protein n=1 Tax=Tardiphaga sp. 604_B6_N1_1 TaxID=3240779 RepID=UPI003F218394
MNVGQSKIDNAFRGNSDLRDGSRSENIPHIAALDDLRGIAALMVFFAHITHNLTRGIDQSLGAWLHPDSVFFAILAEGHSGVSLFLVLSGFLFAYGAHNKEIRYGGFIRNRVLRIYPMYLLMLVLGAYTMTAQFSFLSFLSSVFLFSQTKDGLNGGGFTILLWTISVEFTFYLIFPFLHRFKTQLALKYLIGLLGLAIILRFLCVGLGANARDISYFTIVGRIDQFLIGMMAGYYCAVGLPEFKRPLLNLSLAVLLILVSLFTFNRLGGWIVVSGWKVVWPTYEAVMFGALIVAYLPCQRHLNRHYRKVIGRIGLMSYSIYVMHMPILLAIQSQHLYARVFSNLYANAMLSALYIVPIVLGVSTATYLLIEKPFMSLRGRYSTPIDKAEAYTPEYSAELLVSKPTEALK